MKYKNYIGAIISIIIGIMLIWLKGEVVSYALTVIGVTLIVVGILNIVNGLVNTGIAGIIIGALIIAFGWLFVSVMLYVIAALLIVYGVFNIYLLFKNKVTGLKPVTTMLLYLIPCLYIAIGCLLMFNQGGTIDWVFIISGVILIIDGLLGMVSSLVK